MISLLWLLAGANFSFWVGNGNWEHILVAVACLFASYLYKKAESTNGR